MSNLKIVSENSISKKNSEEQAKKKGEFRELVTEYIFDENNLDDKAKEGIVLKSENRDPELGSCIRSQIKEEERLAKMVVNKIKDKAIEDAINFVNEAKKVNIDLKDERVVDSLIEKNGFLMKVIEK